MAGGHLCTPLITCFDLYLNTAIIHRYCRVALENPTAPGVIPTHVTFILCPAQPRANTRRKARHWLIATPARMRLIATSRLGGNGSNNTAAPRITDQTGTM